MILGFNACSKRSQYLGRQDGEEGRLGWGQQPFLPPPSTPSPAALFTLNRVFAKGCKPVPGFQLPGEFSKSASQLQHTPGLQHPGIRLGSRLPSRALCVLQYELFGAQSRRLQRARRDVGSEGQGEGKRPEGQSPAGGTNLAMNLLLLQDHPAALRCRPDNQARQHLPMQDLKTMASTPFSPAGAALLPGTNPGVLVPGSCAALPTPLPSVSISTPGQRRQLSGARVPPPAPSPNHPPRHTSTQ